MPHALVASDVDQAAEAITAVVRRTPIEQSDRLTRVTGHRVLLKREDLQLCRSYKVRGAYFAVASLDQAQRALGVVCASAGNHAQGVAFACSILEIRGRIYVPSNTPRQKRQRIKAIGGTWIELIVAGNSYDEASRRANEDCVVTGAVAIHPFDDPHTIAGQGTVAREIAEQLDGELGTIIVPVGGGGLLSGVAVWLREHFPAARIIGAEPEGAASMRAALDAGEPVVLEAVNTFVDGAAVSRVGDLTFPIVRDLVDEVVSVPEGAVCSEMLDLYQTEGIIAEPAGALASAALRIMDRSDTASVVCVVSGGNNDVSRYAEVIERSLLYEGLRHYFLVNFSQEPGALRRFLNDVLAEGEDIVLFEYMKKNNRETGPALVGIELESPTELPGLLRRLDASPLHVERVSPDSAHFAFLF